MAYLQYCNLFWRIYNNISEEQKRQYSFFYDDVIEHLIKDTEKIANKNLVNKENSTYRLEVFKRTLYTHMSAEKNFNDKIRNPEKYKEILRKFRKEKIQKIIENNGN